MQILHLYSIGHLYRKEKIRKSTLEQANWNAEVLWNAKISCCYQHPEKSFKDHISPTCYSTLSNVVGTKDSVEIENSFLVNYRRMGVHSFFQKVDNISERGFRAPIKYIHSRSVSYFVSICVRLSVVLSNKFKLSASYLVETLDALARPLVLKIDQIGRRTSLEHHVNEEYLCFQKKKTVFVCSLLKNCSR